MRACRNAAVFYSHKEQLREYCSQREPSRMWEHCCTITGCLTQDHTSNSCTYSTGALLQGSSKDLSPWELSKVQAIALLSCRPWGISRSHPSILH